MTTGSYKRKVVEELVSEDQGTPVTENLTSENLTSCPSKSPKLQAGNIDEIKTSFRKEIMSTLTRS